jgi:hypothetical protein
MILEPWWLSSHEFESYNPHLFDKNQVQSNASMCKFQAQMTFTCRVVFENNINHILGPHELDFVGL